jgi:hypothetical protein
VTLQPDRYFSKWFGDSGASEAELARVERDSGACFPGDYRDFMRVTNGGQGTIGRLYVTIWRLQDLEKRNKLQSISTKLPSILGFADDGPHFYGFDSMDDNSVVRNSVG